MSYYQVYCKEDKRGGLKKINVSLYERKKYLNNMNIVVVYIILYFKLMNKYKQNGSKINT